MAIETDTTSSSTTTTTTAPSINKQLIRGTVLVAILAASVAFTKKTNDDRHEFVLIHLLCFTSWFGCSVWVSFIAGLVMFNNLPRHVFGRLQSKLFPAYFMFSAITTAIAIVTSNRLGWGIQTLCCIFGTVLLNWIFLEPQTTKIMFERHVVERNLGTGHEVGIIKPKDPKIANDPELQTLSKRFGTLHGISTLLNLIALGFGCYWMNYITQQIVVVS